MTIDSQIADRLGTLLGKRELREAQTVDWWAGAADGGPNGDGRYPLTANDGTVRLVPSPAAIAAVASNGLDAAGLNQLAIAELSDVGDNFAVVGRAKQGSPKLFTAGLLAPQIMRRTIDFAEHRDVIGTELLPALLATGEERRIAVGDLIRKFSGGIVDVTAPPYNVVPDAILYKGLLMYAGEDTLHAHDDVFAAGDVGKVIRVSNVRDYCLDGTIVAFIDAKTVRVSQAAQYSWDGAEGLWGTDNTAGMRLAMATIRAYKWWLLGGVALLPPGGIITQALTMGHGCGLQGWGRDQSVLYHWRTAGDTSPLLSNAGQYIYGPGGALFPPEYQFYSDFGLNGARYQGPPGSQGVTGYLHSIGTDPAQGPTATVHGDPLHYWVNLKVANCSERGFTMYGRNSGTINGLDCVSNQETGLMNACFDVNMLNILCIANGGPGYASGDLYTALYAPNSNVPASAGCNVQNLKVSFNGTGAWGDLDSASARLLSANMVEFGGANVYTATRCQESMGDNLCLWSSNVSGPSGNKYIGLVLDDTADQRYPDYPPPGVSSAARAGPALSWRASISIMGDHAYKNFFFDAAAGRAVRPRDYASHSVFLSGSPHDNMVRLWQTDLVNPTYYNPDAPAEPSPYAAKAVGYLGPSSVGALNNNVSVNGVVAS